MSSQKKKKIEKSIRQKLWSASLKRSLKVLIRVSKKNLSSNTQLLMRVLIVLLVRSCYRLRPKTSSETNQAQVERTLVKKVRSKVMNRARSLKINQGSSFLTHCRARRWLKRVISTVRAKNVRRSRNKRMRVFKLNNTASKPT